MIPQLLNSLWTELITYCNNDNHSSDRVLPSFEWLCISAVKIFQGYPKGITRAIILTELEANWYVYLYEYTQ